MCPFVSGKQTILVICRMVIVITFFSNSETPMEEDSCMAQDFKHALAALPANYSAPQGNLSVSKYIWVVVKYLAQLFYCQSCHHFPVLLLSSLPSVVVVIITQCCCSCIPCFVVVVIVTHVLLLYIKVVFIAV